MNIMTELPAGGSLVPFKY